MRFIDAATEKFIVAESIKENIDSGGPTVGRDQVLQIDWLVNQFILEFLQYCSGASTSGTSSGMIHSPHW